MTYQRLHEMNIVAIVKGDDRFVLLFDDDSFNEARRQIGRWAANPELSFTWYDAAAMTAKVRELEG